MQTYTYRIKTPEGLHARTSALLCTLLSRAESTVSVSCNHIWADAKDPLSLMELCAQPGDLLEFMIAGPDEKKVKRLLETQCPTLL